MSRDDYWDSTLSEIMTRHEGWTQAREASEKAEWERARLSWYYSLVPHVGKNKTLRVKDLIEFSWEKEARLKKETPTRKDAMDFAKKLGLKIDPKLIKDIELEEKEKMISNE